MSDDVDIASALKGFKPRWKSVAGWKRKLLYLAASVGLVGLGTDNYQLLTGETNQPGAGSSEISAERRAAGPRLASGFADVPAVSREPEKETDSEMTGKIREWFPQFTWGGATTRLGLSFAIGFLFALALRWFIKTALTIAALVAGAVALLVHYGVIEPFWGENFDLVKDIGHWLAAQTETLATLVKSYLPSGAASGAGIFLGLRK